MKTIMQNRYVLSSLNTFVAVFIGTLSVQLSTGTIVWTTAFWFSVLLVAIRAATKGVIEGLAGKTGDVPA